MKLINIKTALISLSFFMVVNQGFGQQGTVVIDQDDDITKLLEYKKDVKTTNLYKIQLDFGSRSEAMALRQKFENTFSQWPSELVYETPNYKVWVGNFSTRLEADIALLEIKKKFSKAMVFEPKKDD
ncbi:MAG: SPOR domain-containing protein [Algicola sp.]|nr:SPOR domain-containing protein [Algicola sp.]